MGRVLKQHFPAKLLPGHTGAGKTNPSCSAPQPGCLCHAPSGPQPEHTGLGRGDAVSSGDGRDGHKAYATRIWILAPERPVSPGSMQQPRLGAALPAAAACQPPAPPAGRAPIPLLGCPWQNSPGLPGSSTTGTLLRGLCVTIFTVLSDSLLGRLVVSCSGITAFGSGEEREGTDEKPRFNLDDSSSLACLKNSCPQNPSRPPPMDTGERQEQWEMPRATEQG